MLKTTLSKAQAEELFQKEAVFFHGYDAIPEHRVVELFGADAAAYMGRNACYDGCLVGGRDYNGCGACTPDRPFLRYYYKSGFLQFVTEHNYLLSIKQHRSSEGGKIADAVWEARDKRLDEKDAEDAKRRRQPSKTQKKAAQGVTGTQSGKEDPVKDVQESTSSITDKRG